MTYKDSQEAYELCKFIFKKSRSYGVRIMAKKIAIMLEKYMINTGMQSASTWKVE